MPPADSLLILSTAALTGLALIGGLAAWGWSGWLRLKLHNPETQAMDWVLLIGNPLLDYLDAYGLDGERLFIHNELHRSRGLRKLHLETARLGAGLQILHCVFFPDPRYDLPVFGADIVAGRGVMVEAAIGQVPLLGIAVLLGHWNLVGDAIGHLQPVLAGNHLMLEGQEAGLVQNALLNWRTISE